MSGTVRSVDLHVAVTVPSAVTDSEAASLVQQGAIKELRTKGVHAVVVVTTLEALGTRIAAVRRDIGELVKTLE